MEGDRFEFFTEDHLKDEISPMLIPEGRTIIKSLGIGKQRSKYSIIWVSQDKLKKGSRICPWQGHW